MSDGADDYAGDGTNGYASFRYKPLRGGGGGGGGRQRWSGACSTLN